MIVFNPARFILELAIFFDQNEYIKEFVGEDGMVYVDNEDFEGFCGDVGLVIGRLVARASRPAE